jgi:hypothetical protein
VQTSGVEHLFDMVAVHGFYMELLEETLGHSVPVPHEVIAGNGSAIPQSTTALERWLSLLDLAITPVMVRDALKAANQETAEALLRHFARKESRSAPDRDKTDFIITFLYRTLIPPEKQAPYAIKVDETSEFEQQVCAIFDCPEAAALPEAHQQLLREFPFIWQEVDDYGHFDQLVDSGVIQRVRELKQRLGDSFYHPRVLAIIAGYNVYFGSRFDHLFRQAALQIKKFAINVRQQGGSMMSRVDGDVTVQQFAEVEQQEAEILQSEYSRAQEQFRKIAKLKKALDSRSGAHPHAAAAVAAIREPMPPVTHHVPIPERIAHVPGVGEMVSPGATPEVEQGKLRSMQNSIENFIHAADPRAAGIVPLQNGNLALSNAEVEAYRTNYGGERSFRADYAGALRQAVEIEARIQVEVREYNSKQSSAYLWKPHADSLAFLITAARNLQEQCGTILRMAEQRGLADKVAALTASLQKMRLSMQIAAKTLQGNGK